VDSSDAEAWMSSFSCSFARSVLQYLLNGTYELDGLVQSDGCMMATRILDNWGHIAKKNGKAQFIHQIGAPRITNEISVSYYKAELRTLADELGKFSGKAVTDEGIKAAAAKTNEVRGLIAQLSALRKEAKVSGTEALKVMLANCDLEINEYIAALGEFIADAKGREPIKARARLMMIGSALDNPEYIKVIEDKGGLVVADALCFGTRAFGEKIVIDDKDVLGSVADYYLTRNTCPRALDNRPAMHKEIVDACKEYNVQGIVYEKMQNCECWGGEAYYLEPDLKAIGVPMLQVEREEQMANAGQLAIRAEAFVEMLEK
jgi:benzoyl-CoA reductase/2-hydroxyglutaryl-CoA dehydratase subunit BcrC/BadD/HgdB